MSNVISNNETVPQNDTKGNETRAVRIREDVWEAARLEAFNRRMSIVAVLDEALRNRFNLPTDTAAA